MGQPVCLAPSGDFSVDVTFGAATAPVGAVTGTRWCGDRTRRRSGPRCGGAIRRFPVCREARLPVAAKGQAPARAARAGEDRPLRLAVAAPRPVPLAWVRERGARDHKSGVDRRSARVGEGAR